MSDSKKTSHDDFLQGHRHVPEVPRTNVLVGQLRISVPPGTVEQGVLEDSTKLSGGTVSLFGYIWAAHMLDGHHSERREWELTAIRADKYRQPG